MSSLIGRQFGKYLIHEEIGRGGMARVFRATDTTLQRTVALKILAPQMASDPEYSKRFEREAITAANLRHANIVTIFDVGEIDDLPYIAMEYIAGRTLQQIIDERGALGLGYAAALLTPVADAIDFAHGHNAVHRDIKPHNIMVNTDARVVLMDFGIAQGPIAGGEKLTRSGMFMGTPEYISPEQASAQPVDGRSDLYSLSIVAYELITGAVPFSGPMPQVLVAHVYNQPPAITSLLAGLPPELDTVFAKALAKDPAKRPPNAGELVKALRIIASRNGISFPERSELMALAVAEGSSAGKETIAIPAVAALPPAVAPRRANPSSATDVGSYMPARPAAGVATPPAPAPRAAQPIPAPRPARQPAAPPPPAPRSEAQIPPPRRPARVPDSPRHVSRPRNVPPRPIIRRWGMAQFFPFLIGIVFIALIVVFLQKNQGLVGLPTATPSSPGLSGSAVPQTTPTRIPTAIPTDTPAPPTEEPTAEPTAEPTEAPTDEPAPPTPTSAPPSNTPVPPTAAPTNTPVPATPTTAPTNTPVPATPTTAPVNTPTPTPLTLPTVTPLTPTVQATTVTLPTPTTPPSATPTPTLGLTAEPTATPTVEPPTIAP